MSDESHWYCSFINPTPWTSPSLGRAGKKPVLYKSAELRTYQAALVDDLVEHYPELNEGIMPFPADTPLSLKFYFWRRLDRYGSVGRKQTRNRADATNMQKATEDALQGVLFTNDRHVTRATSVVVEQGPDVEGCVLIHLCPDVGLWPVEDLSVGVVRARARMARASRFSPGEINHETQVELRAFSSESSDLDDQDAGETGWEAPPSDIF